MSHEELRVSSPLPLLEQLKQLEQLQVVDLKIDEFRKQQRLLPEPLQGYEVQLKKLEERLSVLNAEQQENDKLNRQTVAALELNQDRLSRSNAKLDTVQNAHEFQSVSKEITQLKKLGAALEEQQKKIHEEGLQLANQRQPLQQEYLKTQQLHADQSQQIQLQTQSLEAEIHALTQHRQEWLGGISSTLLVQYDRVRKVRAGVGIVGVESGRCQGCRIALPPQLYNEVHKGLTLHTCPSCHRLLCVSTLASVPASPGLVPGDHASGSSVVSS